MKKLLLPLLFLTVFLLVGCGSKTTQPVTTQAPSTTTKTQGQRDVNYPTEVSYNGLDSLMIHYYRPNQKYQPWEIWLWGGDNPGTKYTFNYQDEFGVIAYYSLDEIGVNVSTQLGFIIASGIGTTWNKDYSYDRFIDFTTFEKDANNIFHIYVFSGDGTVYATADKKVLDKLTSLKFTKEGEFTGATTNPISELKVYKNGEVIDTVAMSNVTSFRYTFKENELFDFGNSYSASVKFTETGAVITKSISLSGLYNDSFDQKFYYEGELGAIYTKDATTFKVWSPVSNKVVLNVYESGTPTSYDATKGNDTTIYQEEMTKGEKGVFSYTISADLEGKYYTYTAYNSEYPDGREVVDPYAKSAGVNGLRGMVADFSKTNPEGWDEVSPIQYERTALTVYELHVADLTSSQTWNGTEANRKKFLGLIETGTTYESETLKVKTGFDHIKELGVNAVQLLPIFDQANDEVEVSFNWGYNPLNYNVLEGCYSSDPYDGYARIIEFKQVVKAFNEAGINIIMDVVYNHTNGVTGSNFDVLMPGYYFRYDESGALYNGSGCGNETASNRLMFRKFMIDSTTFWLSEYKLGGYRFDLMGLHDIETMNTLVAECEKINPKVVIYGEPWTGGTSGLAANSQAVQANMGKAQNFGAFNDKIRDELVKGGLSSADALSWISNTSSSLSTNFSALFAGIAGKALNGNIAVTNPSTSVTYATCHDNYTLYDRFWAAHIYDTAVVKKMAMLANSIVMTSEGTAFMLSGEEFLRTKAGNSNSYNASYKINELDYSLKVKNIDMFDNYKKLIYLKQHFSGLNLKTLEDVENMTIERDETNSIITYKLTGTLDGENVEIMFIHTNGVKASDRTAIDLTGYTVYLDTLNTYELGSSLTSVTPENYQTIIAIK